MMFKRKNKDTGLFDHPTVNEFEKNAADSLGVTIYSENKEILGNLIRCEIEQSKIKSDILLSYFSENNDKFLKFVNRHNGHLTFLPIGRDRLCTLPGSSFRLRYSNRHVPLKKNPSTLNTHIMNPLLC